MMPTRRREFLADDWLGVLLLTGDAALMMGCFVLAVAGTWWLAPFGMLCGVAAVAVGRELWADWR